jgi:hypothetical protein
VPKVKILTLVVEVLLQVKSVLLRVKRSTFMSVAKAVTTAEAPVLQTETAAGHQIFALAEILSKTASSLLVVAVVLVHKALVVTAVRVKRALKALLVSLVYAKDVLGMLAQVETAHVMLAAMAVAQAAVTPAVAVAQALHLEVLEALLVDTDRMAQVEHLVKVETAEVAIAAVLLVLVVAVATTAAVALLTVVVHLAVAVVDLRTSEVCSTVLRKVAHNSATA